MHLAGLGIGGYRSFGRHQRMSPLGKVNFFVGQNNAGKSNVLRFVAKHLHTLVAAAARGNTGDVGLGDLDWHSPVRSPFTMDLGYRADELQEHFQGSFRDGTTAAASFANVLNALMDEDGTLWFSFVLESGKGGSQLVLEPSFVERLIPSSNDWDRVEATLLTQRSNNPTHAIHAVVRRFMQPLSAIPAVALVEAVRQIGHSDVGDQLTGVDLIARLADLQLPSIHEQHKRADFYAITEFIRTVLDLPDAAIEVPNARGTVHVRLGGQWRTLESIGTGIHEAVMLAVYATVHRGQIICIEEPELHLHPTLQRKLMQYLSTKTDNQYLVATHSAHILDLAGAAVFHIEQDGPASRITRAATDLHRVHLCRDLGYQPTDLLQANAVVWVEGPSDRIYIRWWLEDVAPDLIEGIHYSLMFYGGRLLRHVSAGDHEITEFIDLTKINQHLAVVMDSDRSKAGDRLGATKLRVQAELIARGGHAWVTKGREIENYLPKDGLSAAVAAIHPGGRSSATGAPFERALLYRDRKRTELQADKVKLARHLARQPPDLGILDLRQQARKLARFIREANR